MRDPEERNASDVFAEALKENTTLQVLKIGWNALGKQGTCKIVQSLHKKSAIRTLRIENTADISTAGCEQDVLFAADDVANRLTRRGCPVPHIVVEFPDRTRKVVQGTEAAKPTAPMASSRDRTPTTAGATDEGKDEAAEEKNEAKDEAKEEGKQEHSHDLGRDVMGRMHEIREGTKVKVRRASAKGGRAFHPGTITCVDEAGLYSITYDDGQKEEGVTLRYITKDYDGTKADHVDARYILREPYSQMTELQAQRTFLDWSMQAADEWSSDDEDEVIERTEERAVTARKAAETATRTPRTSMTIRDKQKEQERKAIEKRLREVAKREDERTKTGALNVLGKLDDMMRSKSIRVHDLFKSSSFDVNNDDMLDINELGAMLQQVNIVLTKDETRTVFDHLDKDNDGKIDPGELDQALRMLKQDRKSAAVYSEELKAI